MDCSSEKGASNWLAELPLEELGFSLHKGAFRDALCLRFGWQPPHIPSNCVCGKRQTVEHALSCSHGGFPALRHNDIRDITAKCLSEVCHNVAVEPELQPLTGQRLQLRTANSEEGAQLDVSAQGFWGRGINVQFLMLGFLTHTHQAIASPPKPLCTEDTRMKRGGATSSEYWRLSMGHSPR